MYKLTNGTKIIRIADGAWISADPLNRDYSDYLAWLALGNTPTPADAPTPADLAEAARIASLDVAISGSATLAQLKSMDNATFDTWWAANVTNAAQAIQVLKQLAKLAIRRLF